MFLEVGNARVPKKPLQFYKYGTETNFASQWLSTSRNSIISFKFYVQAPFFSIFITFHLDIRVIFEQSIGILALTASATASLFSVAALEILQHR